MKKRLLLLLIISIFITSPTVAHADAKEIIFYKVNNHLFYTLIITLFLMVLTLSVYSILLYRNYKILKIKSNEINNFNELRQTFIDADDSIIYLKDENLKYIFVNKAMEEALNKNSSELIGKDIFSFINEDFAKVSKKTDLDVLEKRTLVKDTIKWNHKLFETTKFPIRLLNGAYGVGAYMKDITNEYKHKELIEKTLRRNIILVDLFQRNFNSTQEQLDHILDEALRLTESTLGCIYVYHEEKHRFVLSNWSYKAADEYDIVNEHERNQPNFNGVWEVMVRQRKPIIVNDFDLPSPHKNGYPEGPLKQLKRFITVPVLAEEGIKAVICLANKTENYENNDIYQITALMNGVWNAKENKEKTIELRSAVTKLKENEDKLQLILDSAAEGIYGIDNSGNCTFCNESALRILGYDDESQLLGKNMHWLIHHSKKDGSPLDLEDCKVFQAFKNGLKIHVDDEVLWRSDGTCFDAEYYSYPQYRNNEIIGAVITFVNITNRKKVEHENIYLSFHDPLTDLYNRRFFERELLRLDNKGNLPISIIMGDINGLKLANDVFGHSAGDMILQRVAGVMRKICRENDIIARWGGDEFIILLPKTEKEKAEMLFSRIKSACAKEKVYGLNCSIAFGCATKNHIHENIYQTMENAEEIMYSAKSKERRKVGNSFLRMLVKALYIKNPDQEIHAKDVSSLCQNLSGEMKLSAAEAKLLKKASLLHDIGKIAIDIGVLSKNAEELTEKEQIDLTQHTTVGYRILNSSDDTVELSKYILHHHENWDGTGYPNGLKGQAIPKLSRVLAIAESYAEKMVEYKGLKSEGEVIAEIRNKAGMQYDPDITEAFTRMMAKEKNIG